jgi:putative transposase
VGSGVAYKYSFADSISYRLLTWQYLGDSYDNALAETINGLYKAEVIHKDGPWRGLEDVERATLTWVEWFNNRRLLRPIGDVPPVEFEMMYHQQTESSNVA